MFKRVCSNGSSKIALVMLPYVWANILISESDGAFLKKP